MEEKDFPMTGLVRAWQIQEMRADGNDGKPKISGHAAMFGVRSGNLGSEEYPWYETIRKGAFSNTLKNEDIRALWQHDPTWVLGRNKRETLRLWEDESGLAFECFPPDTQLVRDLVLTPIQRGDVDQMSFAFDVVRQSLRMGENQPTIRELLEVRLYEVSPVTFPAYPATNVNARALSAPALLSLDPLSLAILRAQSGPLCETDRALVEGVIGQLTHLLPPAPVDGAALRRARELQLAEAESHF